MAEYAETTIPGPFPSNTQGLKHFWSDSELEPKQQHRFLALFPVYMPGPRLHMNPMRGNSQYLADLILGGSSALAEDKNAVTEERQRRILGECVDRIDPSQVYRHTGDVTISTRQMSAGMRQALRDSGQLSPESMGLSDTVERTARFKLTRPSQQVIDQAQTEDTFRGALITLLNAVTATHLSRFTADILGTGNGEGPPVDILKKLLYTEEWLLAMDTAWEGAKRATLDEVMRTRISPYIVSSFTPPSYGVNVGQGTIKGTTITYADDRKNSTKMDSAQLVLVSTLQDDIQFSLNFLWHLAAAGTPVTAVIQPFLFPDACRDENIITRKNLIIAEMSAGHKTAFDSIGNSSRDATVPGGDEPKIVFPRISDLGILAPVDQDGNMHKGTVVGYHILENPYISAVSTTPFTYEGQELVKTTITLGTSNDARSFYSYQTFLDESGDTRFPSKKKIINYSNEVGIKAPLIDALNAGVSEYPNFASKDGGLNQKRVKIEAEMKMMSDTQLADREATIDKALASGDKHKMNELVTKGISAIQAEEEAAEQRRLEEEARRAEAERRDAAWLAERQQAHEERFEGHEEEWHHLEGDDLRIMDDSVSDDPTNQQIQEYIDDNTTEYGLGSHSTVEEREAWEANEQAYQDSASTPFTGAHTGGMNAPEEPLPDDHFATETQSENAGGLPGLTTPAGGLPSTPHPVPGGGYSNGAPSSNSQAPSPEVPDSGPGSPFGGPGNNIHGSNGLNDQIEGMRNEGTTYLVNGQPATQAEFDRAQSDQRQRSEQFWNGMQTDDDDSQSIFN